jgi:DNA polymerase III epsilon subunit-like protein
VALEEIASTLVAAMAAQIPVVAFNACCSHYGIPLDAAHTAEADAEAAGRLTVRLAEAFPAWPWSDAARMHRLQARWAAAQAERLQRYFDSLNPTGNNRRASAKSDAVPFVTVCRLAGGPVSRAGTAPGDHGVLYVP